MTLPSSKDLKRLADVCRKAGIKHFKQGDFEFTLSDNAPSTSKRRKSVDAAAPDAGFSSDELTHEQLLGWSVVAVPQQDAKGPSEQ